MLRRSLPPAAAAEKEAARYFIGIDLGTSACKLLLVDEVGAIVNEVTHEYPLIFPHPGWSEQKPEDWWSAVVTGVPELLRGFDASEVAGIGSGGQMHGLVALDEADNVIRPAILWNDGRTSKEVEYLNNVIGKSERDDARITELIEKVNNLYGQIMGDEGMTAYNEAKRECENLVNYIDAIINTAMNGGDPMTVQEPSASCTGSCSTCGGCH